MQEVPFLLLLLLLYLGRARLGSAQHGQVLRYHGFALRVYRNRAHWETGPPTLPCKISAALCSLVSSLQALGVFCICAIHLKVLTTTQTLPVPLHPSLVLPEALSVSARAQLGWGAEQVLRLLLAVGTLLSSAEI